MFFTVEMAGIGMSFGDRHSGMTAVFFLACLFSPPQNSNAPRHVDAAARPGALPLSF